MRMLTFAGVAAGVIVSAAVLGAILAPAPYMTRPEAPAALPPAAVQAVTAPDPIQQDAPTWRVSEPPRTLPMPEPQRLDHIPWQVATSAGCAYLGRLGRNVPYATIDAIAADGVRVDILIDTDEYIMVGDLTKSPYPLMIFWRVGPPCDEIRARMAAYHAR